MKKLRIFAVVIAVCLPFAINAVDSKAPAPINSESESSLAASPVEFRVFYDKDEHAWFAGFANYTDQYCVVTYAIWVGYEDEWVEHHMYLKPHERRRMPVANPKEIQFVDYKLRGS